MARSIRQWTDLTGQTFGKFTVKELVYRSSVSRSVWHCLCLCGSERDVMGNNLLYGSSQSCGCTRRGRAKNSIDLTGRVFGRLTALEYVETNDRRQSVWRCSCSCGNITDVVLSSLIGGHTTSCGCYHKEVVGRSKIDLTGMRFGEWTVIESCRGGKRNRPMWRCQCSLGHTRMINGYYLMSAKSIPCKECPPQPDLSGKIFGRLTVIGFCNRDRNSDARWTCECECGKVVVISGQCLSRGFTRSCGCLRDDLSRDRLTKHGLCKTKAYQNAKGNKRREMIKIYDSNWTTEMAEALFYLFPKCVVCGIGTDLQVDHVLPLVDGYGLAPGNATILCSSCNHQKQDYYPDDLPSSMLINAGELILLTAAEFETYWCSLHPRDPNCLVPSSAKPPFEQLLAC